MSRLQPPVDAVMTAQRIQLVGFDADDTLWRSQEYFDQAQADYETILGRYLDVHDQTVHEQLLATERRNVKLFGYGAKGMTLSMLETAIALTGERISAADLGQILDIGKSVLVHPVELLPGMREAVETVSKSFDTVLITKGDLFHQERKVKESGLSELFRRIEIVSEKDLPTYTRLFEEFQVAAAQFVMVGNSLRSDIEPVVRLGGYGIHVPYATTWALEAEHGLEADHPRVRQVADPSHLMDALRSFA